MNFTYTPPPPGSINLDPLQAQLTVLTNVRNCFLYGWPDGSKFAGWQVNYICYEIERVLEELEFRGHGQATTDAGLALKRYILEQLDSDDRLNQSLGGWLCMQGAITTDACVCGNPILHLARIAWLERMIWNLEQHGKLP